MLTKTNLKKSLESLPENFTIDELIDRLIFIEKVERGNQQSEQNETISEQELESEIEKWFE